MPSLQSCSVRRVHGERHETEHETYVRISRHNTLTVLHRRTLANVLEILYMILYLFDVSQLLAIFVSDVPKKQCTLKQKTPILNVIIKARFYILYHH